MLSKLRETQGAGALAAVCSRFHFYSLLKELASLVSSDLLDRVTNIQSFLFGFVSLM